MKHFLKSLHLTKLISWSILYTKHHSILFFFFIKSSIWLWLVPCDIFSHSWAAKDNDCGLYYKRLEENIFSVYIIRDKCWIHVCVSIFM